jgi:flagellar biosynthetic protein FliR
VHTFNLDTYLSGHIFAFLLIFARIGCVLMLFPGISESYVAPRLRMLLALSLSFLLLGPLLPRFPAKPPEAMADLMRMLGSEVLIGLFFGTILRLIVGALEDAGAIIALQTGLSNATILNPALASQSPLASALLSITGVTLVFVTGLDHFLLRSLAALYDLFPVGGTIVIGDMTQFVTQTLSSSFNIGIQMATPFLVMGLLMFIALGMIQRLLPQVQLFLVVLPLQIWGGIGLIAVTLAGIMTVWLHYCDTTVTSFFAH